MTTINTSDDLIKVLREKPEFRATTRRELLTAELLEVPARLTNLEQGVAALLEHANATNRRLDQMDAHLAQVDRRLDQVDVRLEQMDAHLAQVDRRLDQVDVRLEQMDAHLAQVDRRLDGIEGDIKVVKRDIDGMGEAFRVEVKAQSSFCGNYAQSAATKEDLEIADLFAGLHGIKSSETSHVARSRLAAWLRENADVLEALDLRPRALRTFRRPDMIMGVRDLYADGDTAPEFYIAVEASYTADTEDILKATDHAKIVRAVTGLYTYPVVAAVILHSELSPDMESRLYYDVDLFIEANDADAALFYRLDSADLRPSEPR